MNFCTSCGTPLAAASAFCTACGVPRSPASPSAPWSTAGAPTTVVGPAPAAPPVTGAASGPPDLLQPAPPLGRGPRAALVVGAVALMGAAGGGAYLLTSGLLDRPSSSARTTTASTPEPGPGAADSAVPSTSSDESPSAPSSDETAPDAESSDGPAPAATTGPTDAAPAPVSGPLTPVTVQADCVAPPATDSAGKQVTYEPERTTDGDPSTAWRCPGSAVGTRLVFTFAQPVTVTSLALVPGYDKVDPVDGIDRFPEHRTVSGVLWRLDGGVEHRQEIPAPDRSLTSLRLPEPATATAVTLEIASTANDSALRDFTAISEVSITGHQLP